jgi:BRCT domain type II-containing protein
MYLHNTDSAGVDNSFVIQESTNPRTNNGSTSEPRPINREEYNNQFNELNGNASVNPIEVNPNSASADVSIEDNNNTKAHHPTYAEKTANQPATKNTKSNLSKKSEHTSQSVVSEAGQSSDDFIGKQRKRVKLRNCS